MLRVEVVVILQVENLVVSIPFPKCVLNVSLTPNQGKYSFDPTTKVMTWEAGKMEPSTKLPNIRGNVNKSKRTRNNFSKLRSPTLVFR